MRRTAELEDVRLHDLRHTVATHAVMQGIPLPIVARILGHRRPDMTLRYTHVGDAEVEATADRIGQTIALLMAGESPVGERQRARPLGRPAAVGAFAVARIALARLGCSLPEHRVADEDPAVKALNACGAILYWSNRKDLDEGARLRACKPEFAVLAEGGKSTALDVLRECEVSWDSLESLPGSAPVVRSVAVRFPSEATAISRGALHDPDSKIGYCRTWSRFDQQQMLAFGIRMLASFGKDSGVRFFASSLRTRNMARIRSLR